MQVILLDLNDDNIEELDRKINLNIKQKYIYYRNSESFEDVNINFYFENVFARYKTVSENNKNIFIKLLNIDEQTLEYAETYVNCDYNKFKEDYLKEDVKLIINCCFDKYDDKNIEIMNKVSKHYENFKDKLNFYVEVNNNLTSADLKKLQKFNNLSLSDNGVKISLEQGIDALKKEEMFLDKVNKLDLSNFEKFLLAHDFVAQKIYKDDFDYGFAYTFMGALTTDRIVCNGYASILENLCAKMGIQCDVVSEFGKGDIDGHSANVVTLKDEKYKLNGNYFCDACWDSGNPNKDRNRYSEKNYFYSALPMQDCKKLKQFELLKFKLNKYKNYSRPISYKTFETALKNAYKKLDGKDYDSNHILSSLAYSKKFAGKMELTNCENCFSTSYNFENKNKEKQM